MNLPELTSLSETINARLTLYSAKDWNYSPIRLEIKPLHQLDSPYVLWIDRIECMTKAGHRDLKTLADEVNWGIRHSSELGILELVSLRLNRALLEVTKPEDWGYRWPAIRVVKRELLAEQGIHDAFWYVVTEVAGEDFDNR